MSIAASSAILLGLFWAEGVSPPSAAGASEVDSPDQGHAAAQEALADGNRRLKSGDADGALEEYRRAQKLHPPAAVKIEFNVAKAEEARGDEPAAAAAFERALAQAGALSPEYRDEAREALRRLAAALGDVQLVQPRPGLLILIDGQQRGTTPVDGGLWVRPGRHVVILEDDHREAFRDSIEIIGGGTVRITVPLPAGPASPGGPPRSISVLAVPAGATVDPSHPAHSMLASHDGGRVPGADDQPRPVWKRWWFWTAVGAVAATGVAVWALSSRSDCPDHARCISVSPPGY